MLQSHFVVIQEAVDVVLRHLECLPPSDKTEQLRVRVEECLQENERWRASPSTDRERDGLMKRVLALHIEVRKLERDVVHGKDEVAP
jgi:hypothetical protein